MAAKRGDLVVSADYFNNRVFWVTGASSGIGRALCLRLSSLGAAVVLSARNETELEATRALMQNPEKHWCLTIDLTCSESIRTACKALFSRFEQLDVLINNAGVSQRSLALETKEEVDRMIMEVDYFGTIALTKLVAAKMVSQNNGVIASIASVAGKVGSQYRSGYSAAKHALIGFMDCLRAEVTSFGVRVLIVCPGWIKTNISYNSLTADMSSYGKLDPEIEKGMPVDEFVTRFLVALESKKEEVVIAKGLALLGYHGRRLFPNLFHRLSRKIYSKKL
jgi:short-subunit dehydrogenase